MASGQLGAAPMRTRQMTVSLPAMVRVSMVPLVALVRMPVQPIGTGVVAVMHMALVRKWMHVAHGRRCNGNCPQHSRQQQAR